MAENAPTFRDDSSGGQLHGVVLSRSAELIPGIIRIGVPFRRSDALCPAKPAQYTAQSVRTTESQTSLSVQILSCLMSGRTLALPSDMADQSVDDLLPVNCGRCGKSLIVRIEDIKEERTIDCDDCEKKLSVREVHTRPVESSA